MFHRLVQAIFAYYFSHHGIKGAFKSLVFLARFGQKGGELLENIVHVLFVGTTLGILASWCAAQHLIEHFHHFWIIKRILPIFSITCCHSLQ